MKRPSAGERDKRIVIRARNDKPKNDADLASDYVQLGQRWAMLEVLGTLLVNNGVQVGKEVTHRFTFKMLQGIEGGHEVVMARRVFRVQRVATVNEAGIDTVIEVEEITGTPTNPESTPKKDYYDE